MLKLKILHENDIATYTCVSNYRHYRKTFQLKIPSDGKFRKNKRKYNFTYTLFRNRGGLCLMKSPKNMCQNLHISLDKENPNSFYHFEPH